MKKLIIFCILFQSFVLNSQNLDLKYKLLYACKVYGIVQYYHPLASECRINWDSISRIHISKVRNANSHTEFNNSIMDWINTLGGIPRATSISPIIIDIPQNNLKFDWVQSKVFRLDVRDTLNKIIHEFRPNFNCHYKLNDFSDPTKTGWILYPNDVNSISNQTSSSILADTYQDKLLCLFRYWNRINYLNPNNNIMDIPWDSTFVNNILEFDTTTTVNSFYEAILKIVKGVDDTHTGGLTYSTLSSFPYRGYFFPPISVIHIPKKYIIRKSNMSSIHHGDELISINGISMDSLEKQYRPFICSSNEASFRRDFIYFILSGVNSSSTLTLKLKDSMNTIYERIVTTDFSFSNLLSMRENYPNIKWKSYNCDIGYIHMGNLTRSDFKPYSMDTLFNKKTLIFDIRNYPQGTISELVKILFEKREHCITFPSPSNNHPGYFINSNISYGPFSTNSNSYKGKIILLVNEQTQSHAEFTAMILQKFPRVRTIGSQTAGADGNINRFNITKDIYSGFSSIGVLYPDGYNSQRNGVKIDSVIYPTQKGIREGRDEVLEFALKFCGDFDTIAKPSSIYNVNDNDIKVYPTITDKEVTIEFSNHREEKVKITLTDLIGKVIYSVEKYIQENTIILPLPNLSPSSYYITIESPLSGIVNKQLIIIKN